MIKKVSELQRSRKRSSNNQNRNESQSMSSHSLSSSNRSSFKIERLNVEHKGKKLRKASTNSLIDSK